MLTRLPQPRPLAPAWVWRCPRCGSTDAGPDESRSAIDLTWMQCGGCGEGGFADSWERDHDWSVEVILVAGVMKAPPRVAPLAPGAGLYESMADAAKVVLPVARAVAPAAPAATPAPPAPTPPSGPPIGCRRCASDTPAQAFQAAREERDGPLVTEVHFGVHLSRCTCGQAFANVFTERIAWGGGDDDQTTLVVPLTPDDRERLCAARPAQVPGALTALVQGRRFLVRDHASDRVWWQPHGFAIGPHD